MCVLVFDGRSLPPELLAETAEIQDQQRPHAAAMGGGWKLGHGWD